MCALAEEVGMKTAADEAGLMSLESRCPPCPLVSSPHLFSGTMMG